jgi:hypothetical protein
MIDKKDLVSIRDYRPSDHNFIMATFLRGLYYGDSWFSLIPKNIFMTSYHPAAERIVAKPGVTIKVACLRDEPEVILGYSIYRVLQVQNQEVTVLDWIFCKTAWRNIGIAKSLMPAQVHAVSHLTKTGKSLLNKIGAIFNPFT